ncbi:heparinase, partial [Rhodobacteraceae bacterium R_SAG10]|nr:heparinase [Rhodobacteraceae bacterium R_SAG10]
MPNPLSLPAKFLLYWHTLRFLKPVQIYGRLFNRLVRPQPNLSAPPAVRTPVASLHAGAYRRPSLAGEDAFVFLNEWGSLATDGWDNSNRQKLWRYNQHYFDDLNALGAIDRVKWHRALVERWIAENLPGTGSGWEPYPTSLR